MSSSFRTRHEGLHDFFSIAFLENNMRCIQGDFSSRSPTRALCVKKGSMHREGGLYTLIRYAVIRMVRQQPESAEVKFYEI